MLYGFKLCFLNGVDVLIGIIGKREPLGFDFYSVNLKDETVCPVHVYGP